MEGAALAAHAAAVVAKLEDSEWGVRQAALETLGKLEGAVLAPLMADFTSLTAADADRVVAELRGSRWRRSVGGRANDGKAHSVDAELRWGDLSLTLYIIGVLESHREGYGTTIYRVNFSLIPTNPHFALRPAQCARFAVILVFAPEIA